MDPMIDIIIPAHDPSRPVQRAVDSVLACEDARVIFVAHNRDPKDFGLREDSRVRVIRADGYPGSPGFPCNEGLRAASSPWVGLLGSDDFFEASALDVMLSRAESTGADIVLAPMIFQGKRRKSRLPTVFSTHLRAERDDLFYRTAPLGIIKRSLMDQAPSFDVQLPTGEDMRVSAYLWTSRAKISFFHKDPAYVVTNDAENRASTTRRPLNETGQAWMKIWEEPFVQAWPEKTKTALATKLLRANLLQNLVYPLSGAERQWASDFIHYLDKHAPRAVKHFSSAEQNVFDALRAGEDHSPLIPVAETRFSLPSALFYRHSLSRWQLIEKVQYLQDVLHLN